MAIKRPTPKVLSEAAQQAITQASAQQTGKSVKVKSYDPNYPVFDVPVNQKVLVYIPNHRVMNPDGTSDLRWDKFAAHPVIDGRSFADIRCSQGVQVEELGLDGSCPLCDGVSECWDLYNKQYSDIAKSKGVDVDAPEAKDLLKQDRIDLIKAMAIKQAEVWYTFPIVVITCEEKDGQLTTTPKLDANGQLQYKIMWYSVRERTYQEKWLAGFDSLDTDALGEVPTNPAGLWAILNFTYTPKSGNCDKMGSARALKVTFKTMGEKYAEWETLFDKETEGWTPEKAQEVVALDAVRSMEELQEVADSILKPTRDKLAMYSLGEVADKALGLPQTSADAALAGFGATPVEQTTVQGEAPALTGEMPNTGVN